MGDVVNFKVANTTEVIIQLVPPAKLAYQYLQDRLKYSGTDVTNRALQVYAALEQAIEDGKDILLRSPDGVIEKLEWD